MHLEILWTDGLVYLLIVACLVAFYFMRRAPHLWQPWRQVLHRPIGIMAVVILLIYVFIALLDSVHFRLDNDRIGTESLLDIVTSPLSSEQEKTYSAPFATHLYTQSLIQQPDGKEIRAYPRLRYAGHHINTRQEKTRDIVVRCVWAVVVASLSMLFLFMTGMVIIAKGKFKKVTQTIKKIMAGKTYIAWRTGLLTFFVFWVLMWLAIYLEGNYHILGTDKVGNDVFYESLKSIRTGMLIGTLTTLFMLPFAVFLGCFAGYFRGRVDDLVQYFYTTLSSIPAVLLISSAILALQIFISNHTNLFPTLAARADARLLALCFILGISSWTGLCRLLRGETLKLAQQDFVLVSRSLGQKPMKIIMRHILPNIMHILIITVVLDFSALVLAEAVLTYVGVGVDPTTISWGNIINSSRLELAREPIVWWPLLAALIFMFTLVLAANLFADTVRDAFDPRIRNVDE